MGMTIDNAILYMILYKQRLEESTSNGLEKDIEAYDMAIDAMRKYQKIQNIINNTEYIQEDVIRYQMICEVMEDEN